MDYSPKKLQEDIKYNKFNLKKKFGQNFIIDENIVNSIVSKVDIDKETLVIEIGPGAGALTAKLSLLAKDVLCYEIDVHLKEFLDSNLKDCNNVKIIYEDFLKRDVVSDLKDYNYNKLYVVANLPYYITTPIIVKLIEENVLADKIVVMVQKEVGERFKAKPNSKDYGSLSIFLNYYYSVKKLIDVSRNVFMPKPNVDSIVVAFERKENNLKANNEGLFFKLIRDSFRQKRKTIKNNLMNYDLNIVEEVLKNHNFTLQVRAEQLSLEIFIEMANALDK